MKAVKEALFLLVLASLAGLAAARFHPDLSNWSRAGLLPHEVTFPITRHWEPDVLWIDARSARDYASAHFPGALSLNEDNWTGALPKVLSRWHPGLRIVVYCDSHACTTSEEVAKRLRTDVGLPDVYFLHGGWNVLRSISRR